MYEIHIKQALSLKAEGHMGIAELFNNLKKSLIL
jgi:hypothetical protein